MAGSLPQSGISLVAEGVGAFLSDVNRAQKAVLGFGDTTKGIGGAFSGMREIAVGALREIGAMAAQALAAAGRAAAGFLKDSIGTAGDFEQTLSVLGATSGATAGDLAAVGQRAKELGADLTLPTTSATDAAEVMLELSKAGMTVQESMDAAKGSLQLAAAAQTDGATAAGIMSGALNAFNLEATDAVRVADLLAAGANASSASMTDLGQGLQQAGFAFSAAGLPVEDLVTSLAALTNVGLTGSDAGTALKNALMRLMNPTDKAAGLMRDLGFSAYDASGKMKQLPDIIAGLNTAFAGMTDEERNAALGTIFLSDGMKAMIPLLDIGEDGFLKLKGAVTQQGAAAAVAEAQTQGWNGAQAGLQSQLETLQLTIGQKLLPLLTPLAFKVAEVIGQFTALIERGVALIPVVAGAAEPFHALIAALTVLMPFMGGTLGLVLRLTDVVLPLVGAFGGLNTTAGGIATVLTTLLGPLGATSASVVTATEAILAIGAAAQKIAGILLGPFTGGVSGAQSTIAGLVNVILSTVLPALATAATWFAANLPTAIAIGQAAFAEIGAVVQTVMPAIQGIITLAIGIITGIWQRWGGEITTITQGAMQAVLGVIQVVLGVIQGVFAIFYGAITGDTETALQQIRSSNETIWNGIRGFLSGILNIIAAGFGTSLDGIKNTWDSNFRAFGTIAQTLMGAAQRAIQPALSAISGAFSSITGAINGAIRAVQSFIAAAAKIKVPSLVTPGSPTPLELGLRGIDKAAEGAARTFEAAFSPALASIPARPNMAMAAQPSSTSYSTSYSMPIYTNQSPAVLHQSMAVLQALNT